MTVVGPRTGPPPATTARSAEIEFGAAVLRESSDVLRALADGLHDSYSQAIDIIASCAERGGRVIVTGLGKSGLVGAKISASFASLGIPSHSVHPSEAAHGDLGRFHASDAVICISHSGETDEVVNLAAVLRQDRLPIVSITGGPLDASSGERTSLERLATVRLRVGVFAEAGGPDFVAPTSSTTAAMALGDALALGAARRRNFSHADFARRHPGGSLGGLLRPVGELLRFVAGRNMAAIPDNVTVREAMRRADAFGRRPGALVLVNESTGALSGIFTDGDLRRLVLRDPAGLDRVISDVMTRSPRALPESALVHEAVRLVREHRQDEIPVVDGSGRPLGVLDVQDLMAMRLVQD